MAGFAPDTLAVYEAIGQHMPSGATPSQTVKALAGKVNRQTVYRAIANLHRAGHLSRLIDGNEIRRYRTTDKVPTGATRPQACGDAEGAATGDDDTATDHLFSKAPPPAGKPQGVPNSVFELGDMRRPAADAEHDPQPEAPPQPPASALAQAVARAGWVPVTKPPAPPQEPRFSLGSDDCLDIADGDLQVRLSRDTTRALFRWLDRLGRAYMIAVMEAA